MSSKRDLLQPGEVQLTWLRAWSVNKHGLAPEIRNIAWSLMCQVSGNGGVGEVVSPVTSGAVHLTDVPYGRQIELDVPRAFPTMEHWSSNKRIQMQAQLTAVLGDAMLACRDAGLDCHYYQGLHAIAVVLLCQMGQHCATLCLIRLLHGPLRGFAARSMDVTTALLGCLMPLLQQQDAAVHDALVDAGIQEFFALPWLITWFAHCEHNVARVAPVFDFCLGCGNPAAPLYLSAALVLGERQHILQATDEADMHGVIRHLHEGVHWPAVIARASAMYRSLPPPQLLLLSSPEQQATIAADWPEVAQCPPSWHAATLQLQHLPSTCAAVSTGHGKRGPPGAERTTAPPSPSRKVLREWNSGDRLRRGWGSPKREQSKSEEVDCEQVNAPESAIASRSDEPAATMASDGAGASTNEMWQPSREDALLFLERQREATSWGLRCAQRCFRPSQHAVLWPDSATPAGEISPAEAKRMLLELVQPKNHPVSVLQRCWECETWCMAACSSALFLVFMVLVAFAVIAALALTAIDASTAGSSTANQQVEL